MTREYFAGKMTSVFIYEGMHCLQFAGAVSSTRGSSIV